MKQTIKKFFFLLSLFSLITLSLTACGGADSSDYSYDVFIKEDVFMESDNAFGAVNSTSSIENVGAQNAEAPAAQKLIYMSIVNIETKEYDVANQAIRNTINNMGGYIERTDSNSFASSCRNSFYKARIPVANYREFLDNICEIGSVTYQSEQITDVTTQYLDVEARLNSLKEKMERLQDLKSEAADLDQLLKIENQISETQYEVENYTSQLNYLQNRVSYCTVEINLDEVEIYTEKPSFINEVINANKESLNGFVRFLKGIFLTFIYLYPYLIVLGVSVLGFLSFNKRKKKNLVVDEKEIIPETKTNIT